MAPTGARQMIRNSRAEFGWLAILLHWGTALLILGLIALGFAMVRMALDPALQFSLYQWHKSFGLTALLLAAIRLLWRLANTVPAPVDGLSPAESRMATGMHRALLGLTLLVPLAGWALASTSTLAIPTLLFNRVLIPHLPLTKSAEAETFWTGTHMLLAYGMLALVTLHAGAALYHHLVRRDRVLSRMGLSPRRRG